VSSDPHISQATKDMLNLRRLPGRMDVSQVAAITGFSDHDVPVLVKGGLLKPLGSPSPNAPKYFCAAEIEALAKDRSWLDKATRCLTRHWKMKKQVPQMLKEAA